jgi:predicted outer membrane protein
VLSVVPIVRLPTDAANPTRRLAVVVLGCLTSALLTMGSAAAQPPSSEGQPPPPSTSVSTPPPGSGGKGDEVVETQWGPLGPADRDFLFKVKQAGLWENPAAEKVAQKSTNPKFAEAGKTIVDGHKLLDRVVDRAGLLLGVELPKEATSDQQASLGEMDAAANGDEFEVLFANRLRAGLGTVYKDAADMRLGTKNELIRILSNQAMITLLEHIKALEATGRVDFNASATGNADGNQAGGTEDPTEGTIPSVPPDSRFTRTAGQDGAFGGNNGVFIGALVVLVLSLASLRLITRAKKTRRKSRAY